mgnify:CR=1 FL=1
MTRYETILRSYAPELNVDHMMSLAFSLHLTLEGLPDSALRQVADTARRMGPERLAYFYRRGARMTADELIGANLSSKEQKLELWGAAIPKGLVIPDSVTTLDLLSAVIPDDLVIPAGVTRLNLFGAIIVSGPIYTCERGYHLYTLPRSDGDRVFWAGCKQFLTRSEAIKHWGSPAYLNRERGAAFVAAINAAF